MKCNNCGQQFNPANLSEVLDHEHASIDTGGLSDIKSKRVIAHPRDVYPYCSGEFASGVRVYMDGDPIPMRPCADEYIQGWLCADRDDLINKVVFK